MGECDLVLLHAPNFDGHGTDLDIHVRTTLRYKYSYIESAALMIDGEILEVNSWGEHALNGVDNVFTTDGSDGFSIAGYPIYYTQVNKKKYIYDVVLSPGENITLTSFKDLVAVHMNNGHSHHFFKQDVSGIMGSFDGTMLGRDGLTDMSDNTDAFGQEWQVGKEEPMLFRTARYPQYPAKCILPSPAQEQGRRLGETIAKEAAEVACSRFAGTKFEECVHDVMATGDLEVAQAGAY